MSSNENARKLDSFVSLSHRRSVPENSFFTNTYPNTLTQYHSVPYVGISNWDVSQLQSIGLISTTRTSICNQPEIHLLNDSSLEQNSWIEQHNQSSNNLIRRISNWDPTEFSSSTDDFHRKSVWDEAWIHSDNISSTRQSFEHSNLNRNRTDSNNTTLKLDHAKEIKVSNPGIDSVELDQKLTTIGKGSGKKIIGFYIIVTWLFMSIVLGTILGIFIHARTEAPTSTQTTTTTTSATTSTTSTSTGTSTTSTTSVTTATSTSTTTTTTATTTTTTTAYVCGSTYTTLLYLVNPTTTGSTFTYYSFTYVATQTCVTLSFGFQQDPSYWTLDDVSVDDDVSNVLINGDFEAGSAYTGWSGTNRLSTTNCRSGSYCYRSGTIGSIDYASQSLRLNIGQLYNISFYLSTGTGSSGIYANITISP
ncbi:unnamed protein product [Rotaria magnacalcarata]